MNWHSLRGSPTFHSLFIPNLWWDGGIVVWWFPKQYQYSSASKTKLVLGCSFRHTCWKTSVTLKSFELKSTFLELSILHHFSTLQGNSLRMDFVKLLHEPNPQDTEWCFFESTNKSWRVASKDSWPWINKHSWLKGASNEVKFNMCHHEKSCEKGVYSTWSDMNMSYNWLGQEVQVEKKTSSLKNVESIKSCCYKLHPYQ